MRLFVHIRCRGRASGLRPLRTAALAVAALLAGAGAAVAQSAATGVSVYWNALTQSAKPASGLAVDWSALDALRPAPTEAPAAIVLHPPPKPRVAVVAAPKPAEKPAIAAPKPVAPALATAPPRAPSPPRAESAAPPPSATAAMPAAAPALMPGRISMVRYAKGQSDLPADGRDLVNSVAAQLAANGKARLQLVAYASGSGGDAIEARRIALARAVQLRAYLVEKGVQSVRMDVRALGNRNAGDGPADRVDLVIVDR
jgi:outer membrane protein OmpA-like peptidoglycan-associated protein